jgi:hypothetical protein
LHCVAFGPGYGQDDAQILDKLADQLILQKALKENSSDAQVVAEVGRRLEAGETVTVESLAEEVT